MTDIYKTSENNIKMLSFENTGNIIKRKNRPFEKFTVGGLDFYILDLENTDAKKYYDESLGLIL